MGVGGSEGDDAYSEDIDTDRGLKKILISNPLILMVEKDILQPYTAAFFSVIVVAANPDKANLPATFKGRYYHKKVSIYGNLNLGAI